MDINNELIEKNLIKILNLKKERNNFIFADDNEIKIKIDELDFGNEIESLKTFKFGDTSIYSSTYFEQIIFTPSEEQISHKFNNTIKDSENHLSYEISKPSLKYIIASVNEIFSNNKIPALFIALHYRQNSTKEKNTKELVQSFRSKIKRGYHQINKFANPKYNIWLIGDDFYDLVQTKKHITFKDVFETSFSNLKTVKINSNNPRNSAAFKKLCNSFLFSVGYNLNIPLMEFRYQKNHNIPFKRENYTNIMAPKKIYNEKLLYYYQQALSTQNPVLQYLSFYQIIENFHYHVSNEDLIKLVKNTITSPDFSYQKQKSIENVIKISRDWKFNEKNATKLVLDQLIDLNKLKNDLIQYDENYYRSIKLNGVRFAHAKKIREDKETIEINSLSERIHNVRNALIHSKEGDLLFNVEEKGIYIPLTNHEEELRNEIPLIRLVAEQIMINSADILNDHNLNFSQN